MEDRGRGGAAPTGGQEDVCCLVNGAAAFCFAGRQIGNRLPARPRGRIERHGLPEQRDRRVSLAAFVQAKTGAVQRRHIAGIASKNPIEGLTGRVGIAAFEKRAGMGNVSVMGLRHDQGLAMGVAKRRDRQTLPTPAR